MRDFTIKMYSKLCQAIKDTGYKNVTIAEYIEQSPNSALLLRHDVDRYPESALRMAKLEHSFGLRSTYYFRYTKSVFKKPIVIAIHKMGHEIGYHYETLSKANGNYSMAKNSFILELDKFREIVPVKTASMHGRPLSKWDNRDIWKSCKQEDLGIMGEAYLDIDYSRVRYFTDTGRTWHGDKYNVRDKVPVSQNFGEAEATVDLISIIHKKKYENLCILTHPNRWSDGNLDWFFSYLIDLSINQIKNVLIKSRKTIKS